MRQTVPETQTPLTFHPRATMRPIAVGDALAGVVIGRTGAPVAPNPPFNDSYARLWSRVPIGGAASDVIGKGYNNCRKLHPRKPSNTLPKMQTGRGFATICHWANPRAITLDEARRIGSFPDAFAFTGGYSTQWERIGNSVPPRFMYAIASHVRRSLLHLETDDPTYTLADTPLDYITAPINPTTPRLFTVVSTFAGCGGSSLGYKWAGGKILAAVEWDEHAVATYRLNHHATPVMHRDIATVSAEEIMAVANLQVGELDVFDGSPPCQGFSTAGRRQIDDPRNSLFREYVRLLRGLQPRVFIMENVSGMVKGHMKHVFAIIMRELKASGYTVKCQLMDAAYFGVPQHRERVIFIGVRNDLVAQL